MKRGPLYLLFGLILVAMLGVTSWATSIESVIVGGPKVVREPWALATLFDAYCGFLTFYAWVFYKERSLLARGAWLVAILGLGNIAMAAYVLWQLKKLPAGAAPESLLLRKKA